MLREWLFELIDDLRELKNTVERFSERIAEQIDDVTVPHSPIGFSVSQETYRMPCGIHNPGTDSASSGRNSVFEVFPDFPDCAGVHHTNPPMVSAHQMAVRTSPAQFLHAESSSNLSKSKLADVKDELCAYVQFRVFFRLQFQVFETLD